ncbi:ferredoxin [Actinomadura meridiana]|uniref:Ferredoxin n=1 Tax=Actinomadura meridiana TaxID=559626 RepID=A0ABP8CJ10_9ACTN
MKVEVDPDSCIGSGQCALAVPEVFDQDETSGGVVLLDASPPAELHDAVWESIGRCPVQALSADEPAR